MIANLTQPDSNLAAIEAALPIDPQHYTIGDRSFRHLKWFGAETDYPRVSPAKDQSPLMTSAN